MPLVYFDLNWGINQGSDCEKIPNGKTIKILWDFVLQKYWNFDSKCFSRHFHWEQTLICYRCVNKYNLILSSNKIICYIFCVVVKNEIKIFVCIIQIKYSSTTRISHVKSNYCTVFYGIMGTLRKSQKLRSTFMSSYTNTKTIHSFSFTSQFWICSYIRKICFLKNFIRVSTFIWL